MLVGVFISHFGCENRANAILLEDTKLFLSLYDVKQVAQSLKYSIRCINTANALEGAVSMNQLHNSCAEVFGNEIATIITL